MSTHRTYFYAILIIVNMTAKKLIYNFKAVFYFDNYKKNIVTLKININLSHRPESRESEEYIWKIILLILISKKKSMNKL